MDKAFTSLERFAGLLKTAIEVTKVSEITVKEPGESDKIFTTLQKQDIYDIIDACIKLVKSEGDDRKWLSIKIKLKQ